MDGIAAIRIEKTSANFPLVGGDSAVPIAVLASKRAKWVHQAGRMSDRQSYDGLTVICVDGLEPILTLFSDGTTQVRSSI